MRRSTRGWHDVSRRDADASLAPSRHHVLARDHPVRGGLRRPARRRLLFLISRCEGMPPHVRSAVRRILDTEAQRLLADQLDTGTPRPASGMDGDGFDGGLDEGAPTVEAEAVPIVRRVDDESGPVAA